MQVAWPETDRMNSRAIPVDDPKLGGGGTFSAGKSEDHLVPGKVGGAQAIVLTVSYLALAGPVDVHFPNLPVCLAVFLAGEEDLGPIEENLGIGGAKEFRGQVQDGTGLAADSSAH